MKIQDIELFLVASGQGETASRSLLTRISTSTGLEGWGEASTAWRAAELAPRREALLAVLAGRSVYDIEDLHTLDALAPDSLRSAVEMAVWDLFGHAVKQPLCNLLGGYFRRRVPISVRLTGCHPKTAAQVSRELAMQGFHAQTIVSDGRPDDDLKSLKAIREMVGDRVELRFDGRGRFDQETAFDLCVGLEPLGLKFCLDPVGNPEPYATASLRRRTGVPLAVWQTIRSPSDIVVVNRHDAAAYVVIDLEQVGGIAPARRCAAVAAATGLAPLLGCRSSFGIATAAMLHLAAALPSLATAHEIAQGQLRNTVLADPLEVADGMISVPESAGLGIRVDRAKIDRRQAAA